MCCVIASFHKHIADSGSDIGVPVHTGDLTAVADSCGIASYALLVQTVLYLLLCIVFDRYLSVIHRVLFRIFGALSTTIRRFAGFSSLNSGPRYHRVKQSEDRDLEGQLDASEAANTVSGGKRGQGNSRGGSIAMTTMIQSNVAESQSVASEDFSVESGGADPGVGGVLLLHELEYLVDETPVSLNPLPCVNYE